MTDELAPMHELDAHKPTHTEYAGGWWELACTGCDFAKGRRLSHLDWAPHHEHRADVFREALAAAGYSKPRTITTAEELDALPVDSVVGDWTGRVYQKDAEEEAPEFPWWMTTGDQRRYPAKRITLPATVLYEPQP